MLRPLGDSILFVFTDAFENGGFVNKTDSGVLYKSFDIDAKSPRWAKVVAVGNKVEEITAGMTILIEPLRWTEGMVFDGIKIWRTTEKDVMAIREDGEV